MPRLGNETEIIVCPNPVLDHVFGPGRRTSGEKVFARDFHTCAGGFGCNAARALRALDANPRVLLLSGGESGSLLRRHLRDEKIAYESFPLRGETRSAALGQLAGKPWMLVSPEPEIPPRKLEQLFARAWELSRPGLPLLIGCSVPHPVEDLYLNLIAEVCRDRACFCDVRTTKVRALCRARPAVLRLPPKCAAGRPLAALRAAIDDGVGIALLSRGSRRMLAASASGIFEARAPRLKALNAFGAGDCLLAVLSHLLHRGVGFKEAFPRAVSSAAASVLTPIPGAFSSVDAARLTPAVATRHFDWS